MNSLIRKNALLADHLSIDTQYVYTQESEDAKAIDAVIEPNEGTVVIDNPEQLGDTESRTTTLANQSATVMNAVLSLERIVHACNENFKDRGLSPALAKTLNVSVNHQLTLLGWEHPSNLDSPVFNSKPDRAFAMELVLEGIGEALQNGIKRVIEFIKSIINAIMQAVRDAINRAQVLANKARSIQAKAQAVTNKSTPRQGAIIRDVALNRFFTYNKKPIASNEIIPSYRTYLQNFASGFREDYLKQSAEGVASIVSQAIEGESKQNVLEQTDKIVKSLRQQTLSSLDKDDSLSGEGFEGYSAKLPFGNKIIKASLTKEGNYYNGFHLAVENTESFELPTDAFLKPLSIPAIIDGAKTIEEAMIFGVYKGYSRSVSQINRINKAVDTALSRLDKINNANKAQNGEADATNYSLQFVRTLAAGLSAAVVSIQNYEIITTNKLLTLLERSVSCYD